MSIGLVLLVIFYKISTFLKHRHHALLHLLTEIIELLGIYDEVTEERFIKVLSEQLGTTCKVQINKIQMHTLDGQRKQHIANKVIHG